MTTSVAPSPARSETSSAARSAQPRILSIDALRGLVMFTMIFVNDIAGVSNSIVPPWMKHFHGKSGMTFVDLVFPAFLFIIGMSIPFALGARSDKGEPAWKTLFHVMLRTGSLLWLGILMVNGTPDSAKMGWSGALWSTLLYLSAILAFCTVSGPRKSSDPAARPAWSRILTVCLRLLGLASLLFLALAYRGRDGHRLLQFAPFSLHTSWYGILGLLGWAYLVGCVVFLLGRTNRLALLACAVLLMCLYPADRTGLFADFWLAKYVGIGSTLGSHAAITVLGVLLATILITSETNTLWPRLRFTLGFIAACAAAAGLLHGLYGINKNSATPSWCLWACAITALLWLLFHLLLDGRSGTGLARPLLLAGQNVILAYLLSDLFPAALDLFHLEDWYGGLGERGLAWAAGRSAACGCLLLAATVGLNRLGFRVKL